MTSKTIIVAGGSGFIGTHIKHALNKLGMNTIFVSRKKQDSTLTWDEISSKGLPDCYAVIGLQGQNIMDMTKRWTESFQKEVWNSRIKTTTLLRQAIVRKNELAQASGKEAPIKLFISSSAISYYEPNLDKTYDESYKPKNLYLNTDTFPPNQEILYLTKLCQAWEQAALSPSSGDNSEYKNKDITTVIIRIGIVLGRDGGLIKNMLPAFKLYLGNKALGTGEQWFPWIHVDDLAGIYVKCITDLQSLGAQQLPKSSYIFNGVSPHPCTNAQFHSALAAALNKPIFLPAMPEAVLTLLVGPLRAQLMTRGIHVLPKATIETLKYQYKFTDIRLACDEVCGVL